MENKKHLEASCHCGHDHEHSSDCSCGHDHEHSSDCSCGHDHEHDSDCGCGHDHSHSHEGIESHMHDEAVVVSGKREIPGSLEKVKEDLTKELDKLAEWIEDQGGIVGHIKAYLDGAGDGYMLSNTGGGVQCTRAAGTGVHVNIAAIVFQVEIKETECRVAQIFENLKKK